jgi:hypothetical protein
MNDSEQRGRSMTPGAVKRRAQREAARNKPGLPPHERKAMGLPERLACKASAKYRSTRSLCILADNHKGQHEDVWGYKWSAAVKGCPIASHHADCDCDGAGGDR